MRCILLSMKQLVCLISTEGKSEDQIVQEVMGAKQKFDRTMAAAEQEVRRPQQNSNAQRRGCKK